jgi:hypothetical protein
MMLDDVEYLRAQAVLCLNLSRQMSSSADKAHFEKQALEYMLRAEKLEEGNPTVLDDTQNTD